MVEYSALCELSSNTVIIFGSSDFARRTKYLKFDPTGVWTHDLWIMNSTFHVPEMLVLTTEPSEIFTHLILCSYNSDLFWNQMW